MRRLKIRLFLNEFIKGRPLLSSALLLILGIITYYQLGTVSFLSFVLLMVIIVLLAVMGFLFIEKRILLMVFIIFLAGYNLLHWQEIKYYSPLSIASYNYHCGLEVIALVKEDLSSLQGNKLLLKPYYVDGKAIKYGYIQIDKRYLPFELSNGELINIKLSLDQPQEAMNPGAFSYYKYLKRKGIYSLGYIEGEVEYIGQLRNLIADNVIRLKYKLIGVIDQSIERPYNELLKALILGEREGLPKDWVDDFTLCGVNHLLAISGLHVGFIVLIFLIILKSFKLPDGVRNLVLSLLVVFYIILTGFRSSVFRAGLLSIVFLWAPFFNRQGDILNILGMTAFLNLLINPYQVFDLGFQFSYLILLMILFWHKYFEKYIGSIFSVSVAAFLGSSPLTAFYFNLITPVGIIANVWTIPLTGIIVSGALISLLSGLIHHVFSFVGFKLLSYPVKILIIGIRIMRLIPYGCLENATPSFFRVLFWIAFLIFLPFYLKKRVIPFNEVRRKRRLNYIIITGLFATLIFFIEPVLNRGFEVVFLSVGQGDSIIISTPGNKQILIDGGGYLGLDSTQGKYTVLPYLKHRGIRNLEIVFITHFDADHAAGILDIIGNRRINLLAFPVNFRRNEIADRIINKAEEYKVPVLLVQEGDLFQLDGVVLSVLNPSSHSKAVSRNENSIVLRVEYEKFSLLLTGDLEEGGENRLLNKGYSLESNVLKLGHHGSSSSSSDAFLRAVSPIDGIISVGKNNYGHPADEVIKRSSQNDIRLWRTDNQGAVMIKSNGYSYSIEGFLK